MRLALSVPKSAEIAKEHGIKGLAGTPIALANKGVDEAMREFRNNGFEVCQWGLWQFNPIAPDRALQDQQEEIMRKIIPLVAGTGCPDIVINGGNYHNVGFGNGDPRNFTDEALDASARGLVPFCKLAEQHRAHIVIEPFIQTVVNTPERFLKLKEKVGSDALMVNLDLCNFYSYESMWKPTEVAEHVCSTLAGHYPMAHVKDLRVVTGVHIHIEECPLGEGVTDWVTALKYFDRDLPEDGFVVLEHAKSVEDALTGLRNLHAAAAEAGVKFL